MVGEAVNGDYPEATKEKGIQEHTRNTVVAYRFKKDIYMWRNCSGLSGGTERRYEGYHSFSITLLSF